MAIPEIPRPKSKACRKFLYIGDNGTFATITECMPERYVVAFKLHMTKLLDDFLTPMNDYGQFQVVIIEHKHGIEAIEAEKGFFANAYHSDVTSDIDFDLEP